MSDGKSMRVAICGRHLDDLRQKLSRFPFTVTDDNPDVVISYGGDGSLLGAERDWPGVPKCPIRDVRRNPKCPKHGEEQVLEMLVAGELRESTLAKLSAEAPDGTRLQALNDIVISKQNMASAVRTRIWLDDELFLPQNVGDGLLVATPFGSTGYYKSITRGSFRVGLGLAFSNPMTWQDYIVVPPSTVIKVDILRGPALLLADNDPVRVALHDDDQLVIRQAEEDTMAYGIDIFRCRDCYRLREDGI